MERRLRACVELQATETGDLAFMYCVEARPGAGYSPMFGMSLPMEEATRSARTPSARRAGCRTASC